MKKTKQQKTKKRPSTKAKAVSLTIGKKENQCFAKLEIHNLPKLNDKQATRMVNWIDMVKTVILENRSEWDEKVAIFRLMKL